MILKEIAERLGCELEGDGSIDVTGVATLEGAGPGDLSFLTNSKYAVEAKNTRAAALIVDLRCEGYGPALLRNANPYLTFARAIEIFYTSHEDPPAIDPSSWIAPSAKIGRDVSIGPMSVIGPGAGIGDRVRIGPNCTVHRGAVIGEDSILYSGCRIREGVTIGRRCIIQDNAVIGSDGFGFAKLESGAWYKIIQSGTVIIEDDVEIGACSTIDRSTLGETRVERGAKIDNLVQVGHGSVVGQDSMLCAQVGLAGSSRIGRRVVLAGQVGIAGHLTLGDDVIATGQCGVPGSVEPGKIISGSPAIDNKKWLKSSAIFAKLPELQRSLRSLEARIKALEEKV